MNDRRTFTVAASGYFDPLHGGHIDYLCGAKELAQLHGGLSGRLVVIINNDVQASAKKGRAHLPQDDRLRIVGLLQCVDEVVLSIDDDHTVCRTLERLRPDVFAKGGDRAGGEIPERQLCEHLDIRIADGLGEKIASSSAITSQLLQDAVASARPLRLDQRPMPPKRWGHEEWIVNLPGLYCGKRLHIRAGAATSWHYHRVKDETLFVDRGRAEVLLSHDDEESQAEVRRLGAGDSLRLIPGVRHRLRADGEDLCLYEFSTFHRDDDVVRVTL